MIDIDTPDFDRALEESRDGSFHRAVQGYLQNQLSEVRRQLQQGLSPLEFEQARKIETAIEKASDIVRFSSATHHN